MKKILVSQPNRTPVSRRQFLKRGFAAAAGAVAFPYIVPGSALGLDGTVAPSNRLTFANIGVGGQGTAMMKAFLGQPDTHYVAVADVDRNHANRAKGIIEEQYAARDGAGTYKGTDVYGDFREVLAREDIDCVVIATPDHWHAVITVAACAAGKDIYCEKPLANTIAEGRAVANAVKRYGRVLQTGTHERSRDNCRYAAELVQNGRIGKLERIKVNMPIDFGPTDNFPVMPVPDYFDYEFWLGPAPWEPYTEKRCHFSFRYILDYSGGEMTDRGAHILDLAQQGHGSDRTGPKYIEGEGWFPENGLFNTAMKYRVNYTYGDGVEVHLSSEAPRGLRYEGTDGWIFVHIHGGRLEASDPKLLEEVIYPGEIHLGRSLSHQRNFLEAVYTRGEPFAPAEVGHRTASMCHLGNIAMKLQRRLEWNPDAEQFVNDDEANQMLWRPMRNGWHV